ncbi:hypothetical protein GUJ93_ZPchr0013g35033 [Zizania palustris]|uniref:Uncharacterized protein n=1 Tax=Zizania palustris TaxID=103762 RepID=A0A8J6C207_ZIZPA|nr:hypothetical protein GUJ93_ZPchr0013g35033 [Zizania palustris]
MAVNVSSVARMLCSEVVEKRGVVASSKATKESKKFCHEAVVFLHTLLVTNLNGNMKQLRYKKAESLSARRSDGVDRTAPHGD